MDFEEKEVTFKAYAKQHSTSKEDAEEDDFIKNVVAYRLTPLGASLPRFCNPQQWNTCAQLEDESSSDVSEAYIVAALFALYEDFNQRVHKSLQARDPNTRALAKGGFSSSKDTGPTPSWVHGVFQAQLLDKLVWALLPRPTDDLRPYQTAFVNKAAIVPDKGQKVLRIYKEWPEALTAFVRNWIKNEATLKTPAGDSSCVGPEEVVSSLYNGALEAQSTAEMKNVETTICMAALGIRGLALRAKFRKSPDSFKEGLAKLGKPVSAFYSSSPATQTSPPDGSEPHQAASDNGGTLPDEEQTEVGGKGKGGRKKGSGEPTLAQLLKCQNENLPQSIEKLEDYVLLRSLYIVAAISPICLLSSSHVSTYSDARLSMQILWTCAIQPSLKRDIYPCLIEYDILNIILKMAVEGRFAFRQQMNIAIEKWRDRGIIDTTNTCVVTNQGLVGWKEAYEAADANVLSIIDDLGKKVSSVPYRAVATDSIDLTSPSVEWIRILNTEDPKSRSSQHRAARPNDLRDTSDGESNRQLSSRKRTRRTRSTVADDSDSGETTTDPDIVRKAKKKKLPALPVKNVYNLDNVWKATARKKWKVSSKDFKVRVAYRELGPDAEDRDGDIVIDVDRLFLPDYAKRFFVKEWTARDVYIPISKYNEDSVATAVKEMDFALRDSPSTPTGSRITFTSHPKIKTIRRSIWDKMGARGQRNLLQWTNVHVVEAEAALAGTDQLESEDALDELATLVDLTAKRECQDQAATPTKGDMDDNGNLPQGWNMRQSDIAEFLSELQKTVSRKKEVAKEAAQLRAQGKSVEATKHAKTAPYMCLSFEDIPIEKDVCNIAADDSSSYISRDEPDYTYRTTLDRTKDLDSRWMTASSTGAWTDWNIKAGGYSTFMRGYYGEMVIFLTTETKSHPSIDGWEGPGGKFRCDVVILQRGDDLFLKAGQEHALLTLSDAVVLGSHFYFDNHYTNTLSAMTYEHYLGTTVTTTERSKSALLLFKRFFAIRDTIHAKVKNIEYAKHLPLPSTKNLCALLVLLLHIDQLVPQVPREDIVPWQHTPQFWTDFEYVKGKVEDFIEFMGSTDTTSSESDSESTFTGVLETIENRFATMCRGIERAQPNHSATPVNVVCHCGHHAEDFVTVEGELTTFTGIDDD